MSKEAWPAPPWADAFSDGLPHSAAANQPCASGKPFCARVSDRGQHFQGRFSGRRLWQGCGQGNQQRKDSAPGGSLESALTTASRCGRSAEKAHASTMALTVADSLDAQPPYPPARARRDVVAAVLTLGWIAFLFSLMFTASDRFFCPSLELISEYLRLSPAVAGATVSPHTSCDCRLRAVSCVLCGACGSPGCSRGGWGHRGCADARWVSCAGSLCCFGVPFLQSGPACDLWAPALAPAVAVLRQRSSRRVHPDLCNP